MINGVLVIDKPQEMTSFDVVAIMRRTLKIKKIGHTGTLDPMATGVLPICIGDATKIVDFLMDQFKCYRCTMKLGRSTDTGDIWGTTKEIKPVPLLEEVEIIKTIQSFIGDIEQVPPMYSALKVNGQKLVDLARKGIEVERKSRCITIFYIKDIVIQNDEIQFEVKCSKGTYIRTLCEDIGIKLGTVSHMISLVRTASAPFYLEDAIPIREITPEIAMAKIISVEDALVHFPAINFTLNDFRTQQIFNGVKFTLEDYIDSDFKRDNMGKNLFVSRVDDESELIMNSKEMLENCNSGFYRVFVNGIFFGIAEKIDGYLKIRKRFNQG